MPHAAHIKFSIYNAFACCACFTLLLVLCNGCKPRPIKPTSTCKRYAEDTHLVCNLYDTLKDKLWTADSIIINGKDYTQEVLASIGGYYVFAISGQTQAMGNTSMLQAPAYIEDGFGRVVHCYLYDVKRVDPYIDFPLHYSGSATTVPTGIFVAPLPLYYRSLSNTVSGSLTGGNLKQFAIVSASSTKLRLKVSMTDTTLVNVFSAH
jgi:hypothetical protein